MAVYSLNACGRAGACADGLPMIGLIYSVGIGQFGGPMDVLYFFRHSKHNDLEIRYSLRSVARHLPFIRKAWV